MKISLPAVAMLATVLLLPLAATAAPAGPAPASAPGKPGSVSVKKPAVIYQKEGDLLAINANGEKLSVLLTELARQSGLEIRMDPKADRAVTMETRPLPLLQAVDALTARLNTIKQFGARPAAVAGKTAPAANGKSAAKNQKPAQLLIAITVLPQGQSDASRAAPVLDPGKEIELRAERSLKGSDRYAVRERWQARLDKMPAKQKAGYEEKAKIRGGGMSPEEQARRDQLRAERIKDEEEQQRRWAQSEQRRLERQQSDPDTGEDPKSRVRFTPPGDN